MIPDISYVRPVVKIPMLVEPAIVVARTDTDLELRVSPATSCSGCSLKNGCGQYLYAGPRKKLELGTGDCVFVGDPAAFQVGNSISVCIKESTVLELSLLFYLLPLLSLLLATVIATVLTTNESLVAIAAFAGLCCGFALLTRFLKQKRKPWRPHLMEREPELCSGVLQ
jgi:sigma-E factor negative regulatory protein RseC